MEAALASYSEALRLFRAVGDRLGEANVLLALAQMSEPAQAAQKFEEALNLYQTINDRYSTARALYYYGRWLQAHGEAKRARACLEHCAQLCDEIGLPDHAAAARAAL